MSKIYIYGTVYNNRFRIDKVLDSLAKLEPYNLFVVDNYSNDGTWEYLKALKSRKINLFLYRKHCTRGKGRDIALKYLYEVGKPNDDDLIFYIDFDTIYKEPFIKKIKHLLKKPEQNTLYTTFGIGIAKINFYGWKNLNLGEDWERCARIKRSGINVKWDMDLDINYNYYFDNYNGGDESRYTKNTFRFYIRAFKGWVDFERGVGFKNFAEFYFDSRRKNFLHKTAWMLAYLIAKLKGDYSYNELVNNRDYVTNNKYYEYLRRLDKKRKSHNILR